MPPLPAPAVEAIGESDQFAGYRIAASWPAADLPATGQPTVGLPATGLPTVSQPAADWVAVGRVAAGRWAVRGAGDRRDGAERGVSRMPLHDRVPPGHLLLRRVHRRRIDAGARLQVRQELVPVEFGQDESGLHARSVLDRVQHRGGVPGFVRAGG